MNTEFPNGITPNPGLALTLLRQAPFEVAVLTPYMRAAVTAADARRRYAEAPTLTADQLSADGVVVSVNTGPQFNKSQINENVIAELEAMGKLDPTLLLRNPPDRPNPDLMQTADSIQNVVLSLDEGRTIIRPMRSVLDQRTVTNNLGGSKSVAVGAFYFRLTDFERLPLTLICVGQAKTLTLLINAEDLLP